MMSFVYSVALFLSLLGFSAAFQLASIRMHRAGQPSAVSTLRMADYLSSISAEPAGKPAVKPSKWKPSADPSKWASTTEAPMPPPTGHPFADNGDDQKQHLSMNSSDDQKESESIASQDERVVITPQEESGLTFAHAPISYFAIDNLTPKGPRRNPDIGEPHDSTRQLVEDGSTSAGSWWCTEGGWPSLAQRATTEVFFVLSGHGCLTDLDETRHYFGPGDTVILPKGWSGRWDIVQAIHKVWFVHDHPKIEETSNPIRALVTPYNNLVPSHLLSPHGVLNDASHGSPRTASRTIYNVGSTLVACWTCTPGSFPVVELAKTECFHVLEGVFFLTQADGSARRCVAGDTVVLPKGWSGHWDVIETVKQLLVVA